MENKLHEIIQNIRTNQEDYTFYLTILYKMIAQTRDIIDGKGEYKLSYMMIFVWWNYYPDLAYFAIRQFTMGDAIQCSTEKEGEQSQHPYGCWKDIKYLCEYVFQKTNHKGHPIIKYCIGLVVCQIKIDIEKCNRKEPISLCSKWTPRESSKYGWLFDEIAGTYFSYYLETAKDPAVITRAILKTKRDMRKLLSTLNRYLDTLQVKQCAKTWDQIDHNKITSTSMVKQRNALLNQTKTGEQRSNEEHRIICAQNFRTYVESQKKKGIKSMEDCTPYNGRIDGLIGFLANPRYQCMEDVVSDLCK